MRLLLGKCLDARGARVLTERIVVMLISFVTSHSNCKRLRTPEVV